MERVRILKITAMHPSERRDLDLNEAEFSFYHDDSYGDPEEYFVNGRFGMGHRHVTMSEALRDYMHRHGYSVWQSKEVLSV